MRHGATVVAAPRRTLRQVAVPVEHGGWALTVEPAVLGLAVAWSVAGLCLGLAALLAFLARTPLKVVLVDRRRRRHLDRTSVAARLLAVEAAVLVALVVAAALTSHLAFWWPALLAAPAFGIELWFDRRSRGRDLIPELAGGIGMGAVATMIALAAGLAVRPALALWLVVAARVVTSIPFVRARIEAMHHRPAPATPRALTDGLALALAVAAVALAPASILGAGAIVGVVAFERVTVGRPPPRVGVIGIQQLVVGVAVVGLTAVGIHVL